MTKVVNCKVAYIRPQYKNLIEWCADKNNVYIARKRVLIIDGSRYPETDSIWANPFKISDELSRDDVLAMYRVYISEKLETDPSLVDELLKLDGKNLGCWCKPENCHGDILIELIKKYKEPVVLPKKTLKVVVKKPVVVQKRKQVDVEKPQQVNSRGHSALTLREKCLSIK
jgi:hypothetical protein